jgi:hypothetical protein
VRESCESDVCFIKTFSISRYVEIDYDTSAHELGKSAKEQSNYVDLPRHLAVFQFLHRLVELTQTNNCRLQPKFA